MYFLKLLVILILAVSTAVFIKSTPGLILIELGDYTFAGPLWLLVLIVIVSLFVLRLLFRFGAWIINAPRGLRLFIFGSKTAKIDRYLKEFLIASIVHNSEQAIKSLIALAKLKFYPGLCGAKIALIAAKHGRALDYLEGIEQAQSDPTIRSWMITLVELQEAIVRSVDCEKIETLIKLLKEEPEAQSAIWPIELTYAKKLGDFTRMREAASHLKSLKLLESDAYLRLLAECDLGQIGQTKSLQELEQLWSDLPKNKRKNPVFVTAYVQRLASYGENNAAVLQLEAALHHTWSSELFSLYGGIISDHPVRQLENAEKWMQNQTLNASNCLALARLYEANLVLVKAEQYYEKSLNEEKSESAYFGLAGVMAAKGQWQQAAQYYKKAGLT